LARASAGFPEGQQAVEVVLQQHDHDERGEFGKVFVEVKPADEQVQQAGGNEPAKKRDAEKTCEPQGDFVRNAKVEPGIQDE
jgi:hypothetical protein